MLPKMEEWDSTSLGKATEIKEVNAKNSQLEVINKLLEKRNKTLIEEIKELWSDVKAKAKVLESYKLKESNWAKCSKIAEMASQQAETSTSKLKQSLFCKKKSRISNRVWEHLFTEKKAWNQWWTKLMFL